MNKIRVSENLYNLDLDLDLDLNPYIILSQEGQGSLFIVTIEAVKMTGVGEEYYRSRFCSNQSCFRKKAGSQDLSPRVTHNKSDVT